MRRPKTLVIKKVKAKKFIQAIKDLGGGCAQ